MCADRQIPHEPLAFIRDCVERRRIVWTYHVNMRLKDRSITRQFLVESAPTYEIVESYPDDKYLPSYLVLARQGASAFHILFAADVAGGNVRVVTAYAPDRREWDATLKQRRNP
jgi:hypothetical protein